MFKFCFILIFSFNFIFLFSQDTHFHWEGTTNAPFAHFRVFSDGRIFLFAADSKGYATINYFRPTVNDSILVTSIGYKPRKLSRLDMFQLREILLEVDIFSLNEMVVTPTSARRIRTMRLGNTSAFSTSSYNVSFEWQVVLFIPPNPHAGKLLKIRYFMGSRINSNKNFMSDRPFRVRLYEKDTINNTVGKDLLNDVLIVSLNSSRSSGWLEVDISDYNIPMPMHGVFVGFQVLPLDYYINSNVISGRTIEHSSHSRLINSVSFGVSTSSRLKEYWSYNPHIKNWSLDNHLSNLFFLMNIEVERK